MVSSEMVSSYLKSSRPGMLYAAMTLAIVAVLFGGASRLDVAGPIAVRIAAIGMIAWLIWARHGTPLRIGLIPAILWAGLFAIPLLQLIPLPWSWWSGLPGRDFPRALFETLHETPWQPLSLTPDRTINGLLALLPALAAYLIGLRLDIRGRFNLMALILALAVASAVLGMMQVASGQGSALYFYAKTNADSSVGFFSNANHHALFLCTGIVLTFLWLGEQISVQRPVPRGPIVAAIVMLILLYGSIAGTGSRAGAILSVPAFAGGFFLLPLRRLGLKRWHIAAGFGAPLLLLSGVLVLSLNGIILKDRFQLGTVEDDRFTRLPMFGKIIGDFFPIGSGVGSFDPVYRSYETLETLNFGYLNNAHNDYAQIGIEAGLGGLALLLLFLGYYAASVIGLWRTPSPEPGLGRQQKAAAAVIALLLLHSAVDYPLRTAALSVVFAFLCAFLIPPSRSARREQAARKHEA